MVQLYLRSGIAVASPGVSLGVIMAEGLYMRHCVVLRGMSAKSANMQACHH